MYINSLNEYYSVYPLHKKHCILIKCTVLPMYACNRPLHVAHYLVYHKSTFMTFVDRLTASDMSFIMCAVALGS